jgi:hypothetical protein
LVGGDEMTAAYRSWPDPARTMARAIDATASAAQAGDADAFAAGLGDLNGVDRAPLAVLLGAVLRDLLERGHADGLDADDAEQVMDSCVRGAARWYGPVDTEALVRALTGALDITDPDDAPALAEPAVVTHGLLLIADQLTVLQLDLPAVLDVALRELMRAQTVELP